MIQKDVALYYNVNVQIKNFNKNFNIKLFQVFKKIL